MSYQTGRQIAVYYKKQSGLGVIAPITSPFAKQFRANTGGLSLSKALIQSGENRTDGMMTRGRHGYCTANGQYVGDLSLATFDDLFEAALRGTWGAALVLTNASASLGTITWGINTVTAAGGSWITAGVRNGDVIRFSGSPAHPNFGKNLRVTGVTASVLTIAETLGISPGTSAAWTLTRPKKVIQGNPKVERYFTFEEREIDIDTSEVFADCKVGGLQVQLQPNGMGLLTFPITGRDMVQDDAGASPYFTTTQAPTTGLGMTSLEAKIRLGTLDVVDLTACDINLTMNPGGVNVVGANVTPDVFLNNAAISGTITGLRADFTRMQQAMNETDLSLHLMFKENESAPEDFVAFNIPYMTIAPGQKSQLGADGPRTQQFQLVIGKDERGGAADPTMIAVQTSAP